MSRTGGGLHDLPPDPERAPEPGKFSWLQETVFVTLMVFGFFLAARTLPLPSVLLISHLLAGAFGAWMGWRARGREKFANTIGRWL
jgi:hypothetical protein